MTIAEVIQAVDSQKPNNYSETEKKRWLSTLDGVLKAEVIDTHEGDTEIVFNGYDENTTLDTELLAKAPYDNIYTHWLTAQIDLTNGEYGKYNNNITVFNTAYQSFINAYNRTNKPKGTKIKYF